MNQPDFENISIVYYFIQCRAFSEVHRQGFSPSTPVSSPPSSV